MNGEPAPTPHPVTDLPLYQLPVPLWGWALLVVAALSVVAILWFRNRRFSPSVRKEVLKAELINKISELEHAPHSRERLDRLSVALRRYLAFVIYGRSEARDIRLLERDAQEPELLSLTALCKQLDTIRFARTSLNSDDGELRSFFQEARRVLR